MDQQEFKATRKGYSQFGSNICHPNTEEWIGQLYTSEKTATGSLDYSLKTQSKMEPYFFVIFSFKADTEGVTQSLDETDSLRSDVKHLAVGLQTKH